MKTSYIHDIPEFSRFLENADHVDVKFIESPRTLREFVAAMVSYQPGWVTFLYRVRAVFVRFLGMRQEGIPKPLPLTPETVPMVAGHNLAFFTIRAAKEDEYLIAGADDLHLTAELGIVAEPLEADRRRFHVVTIVHYHKWTGPVYFNVIRPFHHVVVGAMLRAGAFG